MGRGWRHPLSKPDAATGESSTGVSVDASASPVVRSVREQCRQLEQRSVIGAGEETIEQLEQRRLVLRPLFRFGEHGGAGEVSGAGVGLAFFCRSRPCSLRMQVSSAAFLHIDQHVF